MADKYVLGWRQTNDIICIISILISGRVITCLENVEMSGNLSAVREMSGILLKIREMSGKKTCQGKVA